MAILKHISSKNANYDDVLVYYTYQHEEDLGTGHYEPILDEYGLLQERENYAITYVTAQGNEASPERWAADCNRVNLIHGKNENYGEVKNHTYIISHPVEDRQRMTMEDLLAEGKAFAQTNLKGYGALIAVHRDTDNDHIHITINSVRELAREEQPWMQKNEDGRVKHCEIAAGGKHQDNGEFLRFAKDWLLEYTRQQGLALEDNNDKADRNKAARRSNQIHVNGKPLTKHQRELRAALLKTIPLCCSFQELQTCLKEEYGITLKRTTTSKTISLIHPENEKAVRLRTLGLDIDIFNSFPDLPESFTTPPEARQEQPDVSPPDGAELSPQEAREPKEKQHSRATASSPPEAGPYYESKPYVYWLEHGHQRNSEKVAKAVGLAEEALASSVSARSGHSKDLASLLEPVIQRTQYAGEDLQAEAAKLDVFLDRWQRYLDPSLSPAERDLQGRYLRWCGCDPNSVEEHTKWVKMRQDIDVQKQRLNQARAKLRLKKFNLPKPQRQAPQEKRSYREWLRNCRLENTEKAEDIITRAEALIARQFQEKGSHYTKETIQDVYFLIRKTTYFERDLKIEAARLDKLMEHWDRYTDTDLPMEERSRHGSTLRRWGYEPDSPEEHARLKAQREILDDHIDLFKAIRGDLVETACQGRGQNERSAGNLSWAMDIANTYAKYQAHQMGNNRDDSNAFDFEDIIYITSQLLCQLEPLLARQSRLVRSQERASVLREKLEATLEKEDQNLGDHLKTNQQNRTIRSTPQVGQEYEIDS